MKFIPNKIKIILRKTFLYTAYWNFPYYKAFVIWKLSGCPIPPPSIVKQYIVKKFCKKFKIRIFIETGTFKGQMVSAVMNDFDRIYSIELSKELFEDCKQKFIDESHVKIIHGDSGKMLMEILAEIDKPCLFWLDGHYSEFNTAKGDLETPILLELSSIFNHPMAKKHVILIDDAHCFTGDHDYPTTERIKQLASEAEYKIFEIFADIIRIYNS